MSERQLDGPIYSPVRWPKSYSWSYPYSFQGRSASHDSARALVFSPDGNIYVTGGTFGSVGTAREDLNRGNYDAYVAKYGLDGQRIWVKLTGGSAQEGGMDIAADSQSSVYVVGYTLGSMEDQVHAGAWDGFITKFSASGQRFWSRLIGTEADDYINSIAITSNDGVIVSGITNTSRSFVANYDASGTRKWLREIGPGYNKAVSVGKDGSIVVIGDTFNGLDGISGIGDLDLFAVKYDPEGQKIWTRLLGTPSRDEAESVVVADDGSIFIAGNTKGALAGSVNKGNTDVMLVKLDANGRTIWNSMYGHGGNDTASAIAMAPDGSLILTGFSDQQINSFTFGSKDGFMAYVDAKGRLSWERKLGLATQYSSYLFNQIDLKGGLFVGGATQSGNSGSAWFQRYELDLNAGHYVYESRVSIAPVAATFTEGEEQVIQVKTTNVKPNTPIYWRIDGQGIDAEDFIAGSLLGMDRTDSNGELKLTHKIAADKKKEGDEYVVFTAYHDASYAYRLDLPVTIKISDTSIPDPTYSITPSVIQVDEGSFINLAIKATSLPQGTRFNWLIDGAGIEADDFGSAPLSGSEVIDVDGNFSVKLYVHRDRKTEGAESFGFHLYRDSSPQTAVASTQIAIVDTSFSADQSVVTPATPVLPAVPIQPEPVKTLKLVHDVKAQEIIGQLLGPLLDSKSQLVDMTETTHLEVTASSWSGTIQIKRVAKASDEGAVLEGKQRDPNVDGIVGSVLSGGRGSDRLQAMAGWDILDGGDGRDLVRAGNGRDILTGGLGSDELWGGLGWNTFRGDRDGSSDLLVIKSDEWTVNPLNGRSGNNADGLKCDVIESLDPTDNIVIQGVLNSDLRLVEGAVAHGLTGIGIYAKGALEALYTGGDLSLAQLIAMTTADAIGPVGGTYWSW